MIWSFAMPHKLMIFIFVIILLISTSFPLLNCGDDDDDDSGGPATLCEEFCHILAQCDLDRIIDFDSMDQCLDYCQNDLEGNVGNCVIESSDCDEVKSCFDTGGDDDDDDDDYVTGNDADETYDSCVDWFFQCVDLSQEDSEDYCEIIYEAADDGQCQLDAYANWLLCLMDVVECGHWTDSNPEVDECNQELLEKEGAC